MSAKFGAVEQRLVDVITQLAPGTALPGERELSERFAVSRMTLRRALAGLEGRGLVERRHGAGTFVARPKLGQPLTATSFSEDMHRRGLAPSSRTLDAEQIFADTTVAAQLAVADGTPVLRVSRLRLADDEPMAVEVLHVPVSLVPGLVADDLSGSASWYRLLAERFGHRVASGVQTVEPTVLTGDEARLLGVPAGAPALVFERVSRDQHGTVVEYVRAVYRGDRYRIEVELVPPRLPISEGVS